MAFSCWFESSSLHQTETPVAATVTGVFLCVSTVCGVSIVSKTETKLQKSVRSFCQIYARIYAQKKRGP